MALRTGVIVLVCSAMFFVLSWLAVSGKSPTMDEPLHGVGAFVHMFHHDWRINPEDPPLWNYWAMLPHTRDALRLPLDDPAWGNALSNTEYQSIFTTRTLFQTGGNDGIGFIQRSRAMMLLVGLMLAGLLAWWAWKLGGAAAGLSATVLYCFDPNFLGHAPLVKNDVLISFLMLCLAAAMWGVGRRINFRNTPLLGLIVGAGLSVKFSGVLMPAMLIIAMLLRALLPMPWRILRWEARGVLPKLGAGVAVCFIACAIAWAVIWASYGFRFDPTPQPGVLLPMDTQVRATARNLLILRGQKSPTTQQIEDFKPPLLVRAVLFAERNRLLPQAWLYGLTQTYQASLVRRGFLLGAVSDTGWWYYFPLAVLFKTPMATLAAMVSAAWVCVRRKGAVAERWAHVCIFVPLVLYGIGALRCNLNLGHRHVLPMYPLAYLLTGLAAAKLAQQRPRVFRPVAIALAAGLAVETLAAWPNYIAFFNAPSRPWRLHLLSDSNLDWGQDLPLLAEWRGRNPLPRLYLLYFGTVDPAVYGIVDYINMPGGFWLRPPFEFPHPDRPGVIAISATQLQGVHMPAEWAEFYGRLRKQRPRDILGGTIYIYNYPQTP